MLLIVSYLAVLTGEDPKGPTAPGAWTTRSRQRHPPTPEHLKAPASAQPIGNDPWRVRSSFLPQFRVRLVSKWTTCSHHCASAFVCLLQRSLPSWLRDCGSFLKFAANTQMWCRCWGYRPHPRTHKAYFLNQENVSMDVFVQFDGPLNNSICCKKNCTNIMEFFLLYSSQVTPYVRNEVQKRSSRPR